MAIVPQFRTAKDSKIYVCVYIITAGVESQTSLHSCEEYKDRHCNETSQIERLMLQ